MELMLRVMVVMWKLSLAGQEAPVDHVMAAVAAETDHAPAELLLAISLHESNWKLPVTSSAMCCGPMQVAAWWNWTDRSRRMRDDEKQRECDRLQMPSYGYTSGAAVLAGWMRASPRNLRGALRGYGCGWHQVDGKIVYPPRPADACSDFDSWVPRVAKSFGWQPTKPRKTTERLARGAS